MKIAVLVSGGGTNLQAIIDNIKSGYLEGIEISLVIASNDSAYALTRAADNGIKSAVIPVKAYASRDEWDEAMVKAIKDSGAELVVLAGYLTLLGKKLTHEYSNRIINIHPALIPSFCGAGMYGIKPHEAVLAKGVKISGATVHFVNENYDDVLRIAYSIKTGYVSCDMVMSRLGSYSRQNSVARALKEMGRIEKTIFLLKYMSNESLRREILVVAV